MATPPTIADLLTTSLERVVNELAAGDIKPNYTIQNQNVDWDTYRMHLLDQAERLNIMIEEIGTDDGGITVIGTQFTN